MASQKVDLQIKGLYTSPNTLSAVPQGALSIADNIVIDKNNVAESRRGQTQYGSPLSIGSGQVNKIFNYASSLILNYDNKMAYDSGNGVWIDYVGTYQAPSQDYKMRSLEALKNFYFTTTEGIQKIDALTSTPRKAGVIEALSGTAALVGTSGFLIADSAVAYRLIWGYRDVNGNLLLGAPSQRLVVANSTVNNVDVDLTYLIPDTITTEYFYQIYRSNGTATAASEPDDELQLVIQGNPTAGEIAAKKFTVQDATPYSLMRATIYTAPSQEGIINSNYEPPFALDMDIYKTSAFYANVRQKQSASVTMISVDTPSFGYVVDASVDTHTNNILDGITSTADLRVGMRAVGAGIDTNSLIVSIDSATQVTLNKPTLATATVSVEFQDSFSLGTMDFWAGSTNNTATNTFLVETALTPGQNINQTSLNLIQLINTSPSNTTIYAYYTSGVEDLPGQMLFKERTTGGDAFAISSTAGSSFSPVLPSKGLIGTITAGVTTSIQSLDHGLITGDLVSFFSTNTTPVISGEYAVNVVDPDNFTIAFTTTIGGTGGYWLKNDTMVLSDNDARQNRVFISKPSQVEAVPLYQYFDIGSANFPIQRVVALRDGIFFFKQDGIYRLTGETFSSFTVSLIDNTVTLKVPESAVPFNNQVFCFTTQGICAVTDSGTEIMSVPIEQTLLEISSEQYPTFVSSSFGVAYESSRQYMFFTVTDQDDLHATQAFIYNSLTNTWTRWVMDRTCGVVNTSVNKLFMAQTDTGQVLIERKDYTNADYADEEYPVYIVSVDSTTQVTLTSAALVVEGMTLVQGGKQAVVEAVVGDVVTLTPVNGLIVGAATVYTPIENILQWVPIDIENPGILKQFSEISLMFKNAAFSSIEASFSTNIYSSPIPVEIINTSGSGWGDFPWGLVRWGGELGGQAVLRTYVPANSQRGHWLNLSLRTEEAFTGFSLQGLSLMFNPMTSKFR